MTTDKARSARTLFLKESFGVLSTISIDVPGYPFGSVTPYCADARCRPVLYISHIAQHTKNIRRDGRVSLTVVESGADSDDVQARGRVTLVGNVEGVAESEREVRERYFRYFPSSREYEQTHDFAFFRLELVRVRYIGGFGEIYWVEPSEFLTENPFTPQQESRIIEHMNNDHPDALRSYAGGVAAVMAGIDGEGFDMLAAGRRMRVNFNAPVHTMDEARQALIDLARRPA